jgi:hypothetical protein
MRLKEILDAVGKLPTLDITVEAQPEDFEEPTGIEPSQRVGSSKPAPIINLLFNALDWLDRITDHGMGPREGKFREPPSSHP